MAQCRGCSSLGFVYLDGSTPHQRCPSSRKAAAGRLRVKPHRPDWRLGLGSGAARTHPCAALAGTAGPLRTAAGGESGPSAPHAEGAPTRYTHEETRGCGGARVVLLPGQRGGNGGDTAAPFGGAPNEGLRCLPLLFVLLKQLLVFVFIVYLPVHLSIYLLINVHTGSLILANSLQPSVAQRFACFPREQRINPKDGTVSSGSSLKRISPRFYLIPPPKPISQTAPQTLQCGRSQILMNTPFPTRKN